MNSRPIGSLALALAFLFGACGGDDGGSGSLTATTADTSGYGDGYDGRTSVGTAPRAGLPADGPEAMDAVYGDDLRALGLRVTRSRIVDAGEDGSMLPDANHLAVYVEPVDDLTPEQYLANIPALAKLFLPAVFDRWPEVGTFDVCQEPPSSGGSSTEPRPRSALAITEEQAAGIDWPAVTLEEMVRLHHAVPNGLTLAVDRTLSDSSAWPGSVPQS